MGHRKAGDFVSVELLKIGTHSLSLMTVRDLIVKKIATSGKRSQEILPC